METTVIQSYIEVEDITIKQFALIGYSVTDNFVRRCAY